MPQNQGSEINRILSDVEKAKETFNKRIEVLQIQREANMERKTDQILQTDQATRQAVFQNREVTRQTGERMLSEIDDLKAQVQALTAITKEVQIDLAKGTARLPENVMILSNMTMQICLEDVYKASK